MQIAEDNVREFQLVLILKTGRLLVIFTHE